MGVLIESIDHGSAGSHVAADPKVLIHEKCRSPVPVALTLVRSSACPEGRVRAILSGGSFDGQDLLISRMELHTGIVIRSGEVYVRRKNATNSLAGSELPAFTAAANQQSAT
ncbi:hypothetical protein K5K93_02385 [Stenotrophomonas sp. DR822]|uniref:hypothetical protein n=1 Tax=Stenotrophomonas sp. DR822 TaxID=2871174 RepID=UPI001C949AB4|nr:hypothetical protein [Stenotrophomonas sp. DR822]QZN81302.1 hypothetical protein K5K93_02385 [Stenotrophomonas sp. DR822]